MRVSAGIGRRAIRLANGIINTAVLLTVMVLFAFGCYAIWDSNQVYHAAAAVQYAAYKPLDAPGISSFQGLQAINPEVLGWLTVYGTHIDYPVAQSGDNLKYINTDATGKRSLSGALFLDAKNSRSFADFSNVIYGHHMDKQAMFGEITEFADPAYFDARPYGSLYVGGRQYGLEFFAFIYADAYDETVYQVKITGQAQRQAYLDTLAAKAVNLRRDVPVTPGDRVVLLSTCSSNATNGRGLLVGKLTDTVHEDPFQTPPTGRPSLPVIDALPGLAAQIPQWAGAGAGALLLLIGSAIVIVKKKRRIHHTDTSSYWTVEEVGT